MKIFYQVISSDSPGNNNHTITRHEFNNIVDTYIQDGWKLVGGVSITWNHQTERMEFAQAVTKED